ncbi:MAG: hypothetical protein WB699_12435 [Bacteroidota bacterium]
MQKASAIGRHSRRGGIAASSFSSHLLAQSGTFSGEASFNIPVQYVEGETVDCHKYVTSVSESRPQRILGRRIIGHIDTAASIHDEEHP